MIHKIVALEVFQGAHQVHHPGDAEVFGGPRAGLDRGGTQRGGAAFGQNHAVHAGAVRHAQQGAQVLGVFHAVQRQQEPGVPGGRQRLEEIFDRQKLLRADHGDNPLVGGGAGQFRQLLPRFLAHPDAGLAALGDQAGQAIVLALAGHHHVVKTAPPGPQGLLDRMNPVEDFHSHSVEGPRVASKEPGLARVHPDLQPATWIDVAAKTWNRLEFPMARVQAQNVSRRAWSRPGIALRWVIARVPFDPAEVWPVRRGRRVRGEINGFAFRTALFPEAGGKKYVLLVNKKMQAGADAKAGDNVRSGWSPIWRSAKPPLPAELAKALKADRGAAAVLRGMNPSMRRDVGRWVGEPKSTESRTKRAEQAAEWLLLAMEGERETPPILRVAFQRQPAAREGWEAHDAGPPAQSPAFDLSLPVGGSAGEAVPGARSKMRLKLAKRLSSGRKIRRIVTKSLHFSRLLDTDLSSNRTR